MYQIKYNFGGTPTYCDTQTFGAPGLEQHCVRGRVTHEFLYTNGAQPGRRDTLGCCEELLDVMPDIKF